MSQLWRFSSCFQGVESVKKEIGDLGHTGPYRPPARLRKRSEFSSKGGEEKVFEANEYVVPPDFQDERRSLSFRDGLFYFQYEWNARPFIV